MSQRMCAGGWAKNDEAFIWCVTVANQNAVNAITVFPNISTDTHFILLELVNCSHALFTQQQSLTLSWTAINRSGCTGKSVHSNTEFNPIFKVPDLGLLGLCVILNAFQRSYDAHKILHVWLHCNYPPLYWVGRVISITDKLPNLAGLGLNSTVYTAYLVSPHLKFHHTYWYKEWNNQGGS